VEGNGTFPGLDNYLAQYPDVHAVFVHGMCTHDVSWANDRKADLVSRLGGTVSAENWPPAEPNQIAVYRMTLHRGEHNLHADFILWSPMTTPLKALLSFDSPSDNVTNSSGFPYIRAGLNNQFKVGLVNDCLADAIIYSGDNGNRIRSEMKQVVCSVLGGAILANGVCGLSYTSRSGELNEPLIFVTESLGSKILFDAALALEADAGLKGKPSTVDQLRRQLAQTRQIFMLANQIPILDRANVPLGTTTRAKGENSEAARPLVMDSLNSFLQLLKSARTGDKSPEMNATAVSVVAFSDPNDLLSYRIPATYFTGAGERCEIVNVIVSNSPTYFSSFEIPTTAHTQYESNPDVLRYLYCGNPVASFCKGWQ
jgi:hypothetical protein